MSLWRRLNFKRRPAAPAATPGLFEPDTDRWVARTPTVLWIELTSRCPFKCVFCTREVRWGAGRNLDFDVYRSLIEQLEQPEFIGLNYSGESIHYPRLLEAIDLACATGAFTELVTALSSAPETLVQRIVESRLDRLAVSIHTLDEAQYRDIYGFGSLEALKSRIAQVTRLKQLLGKQKPKLDFCFVAMSQNVDQLAPVTRYAKEAGASEVFVHPIIGRHPVPYSFSRELTENRLTTEFKDSLRQSLAAARAVCPDVPITVLNPDLDIKPVLGRVPEYYAPALPPGGRIHTCDQSPFESVHVLANGDVVVCEVHDEVALGNLNNAGIHEIWHGERYRRFRADYVSGANAACRDCVWKFAYRPEPWQSRIDAAEGPSPQLTRGWWLESGAPAIWSKKRSEAELLLQPRARQLRISGILPHDPMTRDNELVISNHGRVLASIPNASAEFLNFDCTYPLPDDGPRHVFEFATRHVFRPSIHSGSPDCRDLGFALRRLELE